jgi:hypothetical protein
MRGSPNGRGQEILRGRAAVETRSSGICEAAFEVLMQRRDGFMTFQVCGFL